MAPAVHRHCLVTGAAGFVGRHALHELVGAGWRVWATSRTPQPASPSVRWLVWDALADDLPSVPWAEIDRVLHLAAPTGSGADPADVWRVGVDATARLVARCAAEGIERVVHVSSGSALGRPPSMPDETSACYGPEDAYSAAKAAAELATTTLGTPGYAVARLFHPFGPGGAPFLVNRMLDAVLRGATIRIEGTTGVTLNPVWAADAAAGLRLALESDRPGPFHFAGPDVVTMIELVGLIEQLTGRTAVVEQVAGEPSWAHAGRWSRTGAELGYVPQMSLVDGLRALLVGCGPAVGEGHR